MEKKLDVKCECDDTVMGSLQRVEEAAKKLQELINEPLMPPGFFSWLPYPKTKDGETIVEPNIYLK